MHDYLAEMSDYIPVTDAEVDETLEVLEYVARESIEAERAREVVERMRQELGDLRAARVKSPSVVRPARRRVARQLDNDIKQVRQDPLSIVIAALPTIHREGRFGNRKIFIAALWDRVGKKIHMSLLEFWLIDQHRQRRLVLARADLIAAMPYDLVMRSEANTEGVYSGATFHFVVDPSGDALRGKG